MRSLIVVTAILVGTPAMAADSFWTDTYLGADVGGDFANLSRHQGVIWPFGPGSVTVPSAVVGGQLYNSASPALGLRLGRSFAMGDNVLFGVDLAVDYRNVDASFSRSVNFEVTPRVCNGVYLPSYCSSDTVSTAAAFDWTAALRARLGYLFTPNLLVYAVAGPSLAHVEFSAQHTGSGIVFPLCTGICYNNFASTAGDNSASTAKVVPGLELGGGFEYKLSSNVSLFAEYDYSQFTPIRLAVPQAPTAPLVDAQQGTDSFKLNPVLQTSRIGLTYHF
jgi:opacity protein-like surface antigen